MAAVASLIATGVSGLFSISLVRRYLARGRRTRALLDWGIALAMFSSASAVLTLGVLLGWSSGLFRAFYLFGAVLNVPWLAMGSVRINLASRPTIRATGVATMLAGALLTLAAARGDDPLLALPGAIMGLLWGLLLLTPDEDGIAAGSLALLGVFTATATFAVLSADLVADVPTTGLPEGSELFPLVVRGLAVGGNAIGSVIVIVSAIASVVAMAGRALRNQPHQPRPDRAWRAPIEAAATAILSGARAVRRAGLGDIATGNLLIALGVLVAASGGAASFLGEFVAHAVALSAGVVIMYAGFLRTIRPAADGG